MGNKVYDIVTSKVLEAMDEGNIPWHKPWKLQFNIRMPHNLVSKKPYRGINIFMLAFAPYDSPYWLTFKQCQKLGGTVKKGQKATMVVFWKSYNKTVQNADGDDETKSTFVLRYYNVFNTEQCEGLDLSKVSNDIDQLDFNPIEECEAIIENMQNAPSIKHDSQQAYFSPSKDKVNMPKKESFDSEELYYSTMFHELVHSTGHATRLNRKTLGEGGYFNQENYSKEELVAEMGAAMLCGITGIENAATLKNSAAYVKGWNEKLKSDPKMVVSAAQQAQKAVDYILNK